MGSHFVAWWGRGEGGSVNDAAAASRVYVCLYVFQQILWLFRQPGSLHGRVCHPNQSPVEQRGNGIPSAAINPTWRDTLIVRGLYSIPGTMQGKGCRFFFSFSSSTTRVVTVNPRGAESANVSGELRRNGQESSSPSSSPRSFSLLLICGGEPMVHYNWPLSSCRWHTVSAVNIISAFAYLRSFLSFFSALSSCSFIPRLVSRFDIPKGNYHPRGSLSICGDRHNGEWRCMSDCRFLFRSSQRQCRRISKVVRGNKSVFVWLYLTVLSRRVHCTSVVTECALLSSSSSPSFAYISLSLGRIMALNSSPQLLPSDPWQKERASRSICILRILMRRVLPTA